MFSRWEVDGSDTEACPMEALGISCFELAI